MYTLASPVFEKISIRLDNGKVFEIMAPNASMENKYIQSAMLNGEKLQTPWITHEALIRGGKLVFEMGPRANKSWGAVK
jgi:putative alpha-1,2-mannosidase